MIRHSYLVRRQWLGASVVGLLLAAFALPAAAAEQNASKLLGPDSCKDCHKQAFAVWDHTRHALSRDTLSRPEAQRIREAKSIKIASDEGEACATCHATPKQDGKKLKLVAGVSCESCHGAAADWIKVHSNFGAGKTAATETPEHRDERLGASMAAGLLRPVNIYRVVQNCFQCHTAPDEALVNGGGHSAGSALEIVAWSQGAIRHNFTSATDGQNAEASIERRRQLYVVGQIAEMEFALRRLATSTTDGLFAKALVAKAKEAVAALTKIQGLVKVPEIATIVKAATAAKLGPGPANATALVTAADAISTAGQDFVDQAYTKELAALDSLLPPASSYKGTPFRQ
ncbi:MAG: cytochrome c family protein [Acidobacteriota bacterium]